MLVFNYRASGCRVHSFQCRTTSGSDQMPSSTLQMLQGKLSFLRQRVAWFVQNIGYGIIQVLFCPQISFTAAIHPWTSFVTPATGFTHLPSCICFQRAQYFSWFTVGRNDRMNMVRTNVRSPQIPFANFTRFFDCHEDCSALGCS